MSVRQLLVQVNVDLLCHFLFQSVQVKLELGHRAEIRTKPTPEGFTHDWTVFVRAPEGSNLQHFVQKVIFHLHESFAKPKRGKLTHTHDVTHIHTRTRAHIHTHTCIHQRWSNRTCVLVLVLVLEYEYFLSTHTRVRRKVIVFVLEYITKVIVLSITSHDYIFFI